MIRNSHDQLVKIIRGYFEQWKILSVESLYTMYTLEHTCILGTTLLNVSLKYFKFLTQHV